MTSDRYMHVFSLTEPWTSLGLLRRIARACRIMFGCVLSGAFLFTVFLAVRGVSISTSGSQVALCITLIPFLLALAWAVGCMFIWRGVYPPSQPSAGNPPPPEPPTQGSPRPAPLRPFSPLIQAAHAELPNDRSA
jgi:hypothetical protein